MSHCNSITIVHLVRTETDKALTPSDVETEGQLGGDQWLLLGESEGISQVNAQKVIYTQ